MGVSLTLKHVKALGAGRYEYRRRVPESVKAHMGKSEFKRVFTATSAATLAKEHARISLEFDRAVAGAMPQDTSRLTLRETAKAAKEEAAGCWRASTGPLMKTRRVTSSPMPWSFRGSLRSSGRLSCSPTRNSPVPPLRMPGRCM